MTSRTMNEKRNEQYWLFLWVLLQTSVLTLLFRPLYLSSPPIVTASLLFCLLWSTSIRELRERNEVAQQLVAEKFLILANKLRRRKQL